MSDLDQLQKNLNYKIKAQDIGFASWKGSHGKPQKMFIPTKDYLLNSASKIQDDIKKRNEMMEDYISQQRTPIYRYDEYGNIITDVDGKPKEYKFHDIDPPELDLTPLRINFYDPMGRRMIDQDLNIDEQKKFLQDKQLIIERNNEEMNEKIRQFTEDLEINQRDIIDIDKAIQDLKDENEELYKIPNLQGRAQKVKLNKGAISYLLRDKRDKTKMIEDIKDIIKNTLEEKEEFISDIEKVGANIQNKLKENEKKVELYNTELNSLNTGALNTSKQFNETDEEYLQRLQQMADLPFADARTEEKALMREKDKLRDNLKLIIRDNAIVNQVINSIYINEPFLLPELNKFFPGFKQYFIKKFGENNEKIRFNDILQEITFYLKRSTDPNVLKGNVINPEEIAQAVTRNLPTSLIPYQARTTSTQASPFNSPFSDEFGTSPEQIINEFQQFVEATDKGIKSLKAPGKEVLTGSEYEDIIPGELSEEEEEEEKLPENTVIKMTLLDDDKTLHLYILGDEKRKIFIKYCDQDMQAPKKTLFPDETGKQVSIPKYDAPNFFYSIKNKKKSFKFIGGIRLIDAIAAELEVPLTDILKFFKISRRVSVTKQMILEKLKQTGLKPTREDFVILRYEFNDKGKPLLGWGIKHAQDIPEKVQFGSNILFLKKLFLKNILSIQNKHNTKINGFNNVNVSDNFVKIIMNLLKNINFTNNDLQNLTNGERILLDNLLTLSELNKKFVTGSNTNSLNQLKKDYEILIGEIEAGNNNELLKKKLYTLLMKFVHFGALSQQQARKHYKEIIKDYF